MSEFLKLVEDKKQGRAHSAQEIDWIVGNLDSIPDYQLSAWLMAVCINGLNDAETTELTRAMAYSGHVLTLKRHAEINEKVDSTEAASLSKSKALSEHENGAYSDVSGVNSAGNNTAIAQGSRFWRGFVDKHSTGGVGDKVSLVLSPLLASVGFTVSKFSGRSLGHTGGTIDKLEAIPGFRTDLDMRRFEKQIEKVGMALASQTLEFAPADKRLYALRDKSGTVESIPLIASSVMSKKIAGGADIIILDVKCGSGAFMKNLKEASKLAKQMKKIGDGLNLNVKALITNMDQPLGSAIGNSLEVQEAIDALQGKVKNDFYELCIALSATITDRKELEEAIESGKAYAKFKEFVEAQEGDLNKFTHELDDPAIHKIEIKATENGFVKSLDALAIGQISHEIGYTPIHDEELVSTSAAFDGATGKALGGDNASIKNYDIDNSAGIMLHAKIGDEVKTGDTIFSMQAKDKAKLEKYQDKVLDAYVFSKSKVNKPKLILDSFV